MSLQYFGPGGACSCDRQKSAECVCGGRAGAHSRYLSGNAIDWSHQALLSPNTVSGPSHDRHKATLVFLENLCFDTHRRLCTCPRHDCSRCAARCKRKRGAMECVQGASFTLSCCSPQASSRCALCSLHRTIVHCMIAAHFSAHRHTNKDSGS